MRDALLSGIQAGQANRLNREQQKIKELEAELLKKQVSEKDEVIDILKKSLAAAFMNG